MPKNLMASMNQSKLNSFLALWASFSGDVQPSEVFSCFLFSKVQKTVVRVKELKSLTFVPWLPANLQFVVTKNSVDSNKQIRGFLLANSTGIAQVSPF